MLESSKYYEIYGDYSKGLKIIKKFWDIIKFDNFIIFWNILFF